MILFRPDPGFSMPIELHTRLNICTEEARGGCGWRLPASSWALGVKRVKLGLGHLEVMGSGQAGESRGPRAKRLGHSIPPQGQGQTQSTRYSKKAHPWGEGQGCVSKQSETVGGK